MTRNNDPFSDPTSGGDRVDMSTLENHLLLFYPTEYMATVNGPDGKPVSGGIMTENGRKDVVVTDIHDLTDGAIYRDVWLMQGYLVGTLKRKVEAVEPCLGVMGRGEAKKNGWNKPYILGIASDEQKDFARKYITDTDPAPAPVKEKDPFAV